MNDYKPALVLFALLAAVSTITLFVYAAANSLPAPAVPQPPAPLSRVEQCEFDTKKVFVEEWNTFCDEFEVTTPHPSNSDLKCDLSAGNTLAQNAQNTVAQRQINRDKECRYTSY
jgi:hypothetical protein